MMYAFFIRTSSHIIKDYLHYASKERLDNLPTETEKQAFADTFVVFATRTFPLYWPCVHIQLNWIAKPTAVVLNNAYNSFS